MNWGDDQILHHIFFQSGEGGVIKFYITSFFESGRVTYQKWPLHCMQNWFWSVTHFWVTDHNRFRTLFWGSKLRQNCNRVSDSRSSHRPGSVGTLIFRSKIVTICVFYMSTVSSRMAIYNNMQNVNGHLIFRFCKYTQITYNHLYRNVSILTTS